MKIKELGLKRDNDGVWLTIRVGNKVASILIGMECRGPLFKSILEEYLASPPNDDTLRQALSFAVSVIKSGEPWTEECERIIGGALR